MQRWRAYRCWIISLNLINMRTKEQPATRIGNRKRLPYSTHTDSSAVCYEVFALDLPGNRERMVGRKGGMILLCCCPYSCLILSHLGVYGILSAWQLWKGTKEAFRDKGSFWRGEGPLLGTASVPTPSAVSWDTTRGNYARKLAQRERERGERKESREERDALGLASRL